MYAALRLAVRNGRPVIPVVLAEAPGEPCLPLFLGERTWVDLRPGSDRGLACLLWGIIGRSSPGARADSPGEIGAARLPVMERERSRVRRVPAWMPAGAFSIPVVASGAGLWLWLYPGERVMGDDGNERAAGH